MFKLLLFMVDCIPWQKYKNVLISPNFFIEKAFFLSKETFFSYSLELAKVEKVYICNPSNL